MKNLKIGKKLFVTFTSILTLFVLATGVFFYSLINISDSYTYFSKEIYTVSNRVTNMCKDIQAVAKFMMYAITSPDQYQTYMDEAQNCLDSLSDGADFLYENSTIDKSIIDNFLSNMDKSVSHKNNIFTYLRNGKNQEALELYYSKYYPVLIKANENLVEISNYAQERATHTSLQVQTQISFSYIIGSIISVMVFIIIIFFGIYITKSLTRPILELKVIARGIIKGELGQAITYYSKDELGDLSESMRAMSESLRELIEDISYGLMAFGEGNFTVDSKNKSLYVGEFQNLSTSMYMIIEKLSGTLNQINQSADQVSTGSDYVSDGAQVLSQGATEQASAIEELATTINEISVQVKTNTKNAREATEKVSKACGEVTQSNQQMQQLVVAMNEIRDASQKIGNVIKTIEDIAFQTNILALNAAIEAARASAAGKGFAVVADEVRNLASKSADAAKETTTLIQSTILAVAEGMQLADKTAQSLVLVVDGAKEVSVLVDKIAMASEEQTNAVMQVTSRIGQISSVVEMNSATAQESAATSEELSMQATMLKRLVRQFKLRENTEEIAIAAKNKL